jgi:hypothetical protein
MTLYIVNESTEDMVEAGDNLQDAIRLAREITGEGPAGDLVSALESGGQAVRQFVRLPDGTVAEQSIARRVNRPRSEAGSNGAEQVVTADQPRD